MERYLIINADDFGMCHAGNRAVFELLECGGITSSTIMAPCPWAKEAVRYANAHPEFAVGLHLTTTSEWSAYRWAPVARNNTDSLRDEEGFMWHESDEFAEHAELSEVEAELQAQYDRVTALGFKPSHFDNHMGSLYGVDTGRIELLEMTVKFCAKYGMPYRLPTKLEEAQFSNETLDIKIPKEMIYGFLSSIKSACDAMGVAVLDYLMPGDWNGPQKDSFENYREYIYEMYRAFPEGVTETYIHPALPEEELKGITGNWQHRVWEYELFKDPKTRQHIESLGIKLINYRDLKKMRFGE